MTHKPQLIVFIALNEDGEYEVGLTAEEAGERLHEQATSYLIRTVEIAVHMALPQAEEGPVIEIPDTAGTTTQVEVEAAE